MRPRDHLQFERMMQFYGLRAIEKRVTPLGDILLADTVGPVALPDKRIVYQTAWCVVRDKADVARWLEFEINHNPECTEAGKQALRLAAAVQDAYGWIEANAQLRRYH